MTSANYGVPGSSWTSS